MIPICPSHFGCFDRNGNYTICQGCISANTCVDVAAEAYRNRKTPRLTPGLDEEFSKKEIE